VPSALHACSVPGASGLLLNLRLFHILPNDTADSSKSAKGGGAGASAAAGMGLVTDLKAAQTFSRPLSLRDLRQLSRQLMPFNEMARALSAVHLRSRGCTCCSIACTRLGRPRMHTGLRPAIGRCDRLPCFVLASLSMRQPCCTRHLHPSCCSAPVLQPFCGCKPLGGNE
jgi:hypothetical protein